MQHRHLQHEEFSLAAIDDIILHGKYQDWLDLLSALKTNPELGEKVLRVCESDRTALPNQRYVLWKAYIQRKQ